jgi:molybdate transport system substrate-binding protein
MKALKLIVAAIIIAGGGYLVYSTIAPKNELSAGNQKLFVGAGAGLKTVLDPLALEFKEKTGIDVDHSYLCSAMVLTNTQLTRSGDIVFFGSEHYMDLALEKGVVDENSMTSVGYMIPIIGVQKGNPKKINTIEDLARPGLKVGLGEPDAVAVGRLTLNMLENLELFDAIDKNVVLRAGSASKLVIPLAMKNLDAIINWLPITKLYEDKVDIIYIDPNKLMYSKAAVALTKYSKQKGNAKKYLDFITSEYALGKFKEFGYDAYFDASKIGQVR